MKIRLGRKNPKRLRRTKGEPSKLTKNTERIQQTPKEHKDIPKDAGRTGGKPSKLKENLDREACSPCRTFGKFDRHMENMEDPSKLTVNMEPAQ